MTTEPGDRLLRSGEVAAYFRVRPKTVVRWHRQGKINAIITPSGQRKFRESEVRRVFTEINGDASSSEDSA